VFVLEVTFISRESNIHSLTGLEDIDGDGRLDYCVVTAGGDLICWRNGGSQKESVEYWEDLGQVWTMADSGMSNPGIEQLRLGE
jgi:hypothetical protein